MIIRAIDDGNGCKMELTQTGASLYDVKEYKENGRCWSFVLNFPTLESANKRFDNNIKFAKSSGVHYLEA